MRCGVNSVRARSFWTSRRAPGPDAGSIFQMVTPRALPEGLPLVVSGRAVNLLAKPIPNVSTAADFSSVMATMRELGVAGTIPQELQQRA